MHLAEAAGLLYLLVGVVGLVGNGSMIYLLSNMSSYYKSAYMLMVNLCISDLIMSLVVGCHVGVTLATNVSIFSDTVVCLLDVTCWFVGVLTYAALAVNRCVGVLHKHCDLVDCSKTRTALLAALGAWMFGIGIGVTSSFPKPTLGIDHSILTMNYYGNVSRAQFIMWTNVTTNAISILIQWICSSLILANIWTQKKRANTRSRNYRQQVRLFFQFFYPSIICTASSLMFFSLPFYAQHMGRLAFVCSHLLWLVNHVCNPFIYLYFNEKLRIGCKNCFKEPPCFPIEEDSWTFEETTRAEGLRLLKHRSLSAPVVQPHSNGTTSHVVSEM